MYLSETAEVLDAISGLRDRGRPMALATIVDVSGSTYRRPGARLLIPEEGDPVGNLSGGCLEGEVEAIAREVMSAGVPRLEIYDLTADDEAVWGWGLGCNGAIEVFVEPAANAAEVAAAIRTAIDEERPIAVATVIESSTASMEPGARMLLHGRGETEGSAGSPEADAAVRSEMQTALAVGRSTTSTLELGGGTVRVFVEVIEPPLRLLVCGAGHDAIPLVKLAAGLGWRVTVIDDREGFLDRGRFPNAAGFVLSDPKDAAKAAGVDGRTYAVVMSHNFLRDKDYLRSFSQTDLAYLGMLGPRPRFARLTEDLQRDGVDLGDEFVARIHTPAGLDLGSEGPDEIAAAIVAEILAVERGRTAGFLKDRDAPIHDHGPRPRA